MPDEPSCDETCHFQVTNPFTGESEPGFAANDVASFIEGAQSSSGSDFHVLDYTIAGESVPFTRTRVSLQAFLFSHRGSTLQVCITRDSAREHKRVLDSDIEHALLDLEKNDRHTWMQFRMRFPVPQIWEEVGGSLLAKFGPPSGWDVSYLTCLDYFFAGTDFNEDIGHWVTSSVTSMEGMFQHTSAFNQNLSRWDVSRVDNMAEMFCCAQAFDGDVSTWDVSRVRRFESMFLYAPKFTCDLSTWRVSSDANTRNMMRRD